MITKETILRRIVDPVFAPAPVVDRRGQNAYATNDVTRFLSRSEVVSGLLVSSSAIALSIALSSTPATSLMLAFYLASGFIPSNLITYVTEKENDQLSPLPLPRFFLDRTQKGAIEDIDPLTQIYLQAGRDSALSNIKNQLPFQIALTAALSMFVSPAMPLIAFATLNMRLASRYWRYDRALNGDWKVLDEPPARKEEKVSPPDYLKLASMFPC